jgi:hypothetical protein
MTALTERLVADTLDAVRWMLAQQSPVGESFGERVAGFVRDGLAGDAPARRGSWRRTATGTRLKWSRLRRFDGGRAPIE